MSKYQKYLAKKFVWYLVTFIVVLVLNFFLPRLLPGNPVAYLTGFSEQDMTPAQVAFYEEALHLNKPLAAQFGFYLRSLLDGTLGYSYKKDAAVSALIGEKIGYTLQITVPAVLLSAAAVLLWPDFFRRLLRPVWLRRLVGCVAAVCMTVILVTLGKMASAALHHPADGQDCTVVVLGCQVFPDGHPSLMLRGRINAAYDYLSAHPDAVCVASGGMDDSEPITEAQCIRDTLVSMGIDPGRIYMEDRSRSTEENLAFSAEIIRANGLPADVAIASDNFHQLRGAIWAERSGLTPYAIGCASPWFLTAGYWTRETAALLYMVVTGG